MKNATVKLILLATLMLGATSAFADSPLPPPPPASSTLQVAITVFINIVTSVI
jgi:hypothetical protein